MEILGRMARLEKAFVARKLNSSQDSPPTIYVSSLVRAQNMEVLIIPWVVMR